MLIGSIGNAIIDAVQFINNYIDARNERIAEEEKQKQRDLMREDIRRLTRRADNYLKLV